MYPKVAILLAAYNGMEYLPAQLESILQQSAVDVDIYVSVDESDDGTEEYISQVSAMWENILPLPFGMKFGGAGKNFFHLLMSVDFSGYDYISFSDQDDIWSSDKLEHAINMMKRNSASCYSGNVIAFWDDGRKVLIDKAQKQQKWDYLFEAAGPGCTYVLNNYVATNFSRWLSLSYRIISDEIYLHDWLLYAYARANGFSWFIDSTPKMYYRQHANNQVGTNNSIAAAKKRFKLICDKWYFNQVLKISEVTGGNYLQIYKSGLSNGYLGKLFLLFNIRSLRRRTRDRVVLAFLLLFNLF